MGAASIPMPDGLLFEQWANYVCEAYADQGVPQPGPWRVWGQQLLLFIDIPDVPNTVEFDDWLPWARRCMEFFN